MNIAEFEEHLYKTYPELNTIILDGFFEDMYIESIIIYESKRCQGIGTKVINEVCKYADENSLILSVTPSNHLGSNLERLTDFYKRFGFVYNNYSQTARGVLIRVI